MSRVAAAVFATAFFIGNMLALLIAGFAEVVYPDENATPENTDKYDGVLVPAAITFAVSLAVLIAVARNRRRLALSAFATHLVASSVFLVIALRLSDASDTRLLVFAVAVELVGLAAVMQPTSDQGRRATPSPG